MAKKSDIVYDLAKQATAAKVLADNVRAVFGNDEDLVGTAIEGETGLYEVVESAIDRMMVLEAYMNALKDKIEDMKARADRFKRQHETLKEAMHLALQTAEMPSLELAVATLSQRKLADDCQIDDETQLPSKFFTQPPLPDPKLDKKAVIEALQAKETVDGARLITGRSTLSIRYK